MATPPNKQPNLPVDVVQSIIQTEQMKIAQKAEELKLKSKEVEVNERLAKTSMEYQFKLEEKKPKEHRYTTIMYALCGFAFLALFLWFLAYLVVNGKDAFATEFLKWISYLIVSFLSFLAGRVTKKSKSDDSIKDAEIIN